MSPVCLCCLSPTSLMPPVATDTARHDPQQKLSVRCRCHHQQQQQQPTARVGLAMEICGCQTLYNKHQGQAGGQRPETRLPLPSPRSRSAPDTMPQPSFAHCSRSGIHTEPKESSPNSTEPESPHLGAKGGRMGGVRVKGCGGGGRRRRGRGQYGG